MATCAEFMNELSLRLCTLQLHEKTFCVERHKQGNVPLQEVLINCELHRT